MQPIIYKLNLDLHESNSQYFLKLSRGDVGSEIRATFNEAGKSYSLENCTCKFSALKGDGNYIYNDCTVNTESNYVSYIITDQTTAACGVEKCQLIVIGNDGKIKAAPKFELIIEDKIYDEQEIIDSTSEFNTITSLQSSVSTNTSDISSLQNDVSNNSSNISMLQTEIQGTGTSIALSINNSTYVMTLQLKNSQGNVLSSGTVDLPLETMVVGASYDKANKSIILTLQNGNTVNFSVADLVSGLVSESDLNTSLSTLQSDVSTNSSDISALKTNISANSNDITSLKSRVSTNESNISSLQSAVTNLDEDKANWTEVYTCNEADELFVNNSTYQRNTGHGIRLGLNNSTYAISVWLENSSGGALSQSGVTLPLGTMVVGGSYNNTNKSIVLTLKNGSTISFSIADLISGLESASNKVTTISSASTNTQYPSAKAVYDYLQSLNGNGVNY